jgi:hypothetical protein
LVWTTKGPLGRKEREWGMKEILGITTDRQASSRSFTVQDASEGPVRVVLKARRRVVTLAEGEEMEMRWLATRLRAVLGVGR